jgi:hypothetical protein
VPESIKNASSARTPEARQANMAKRTWTERFMVILLPLPSILAARLDSFASPTGCGALVFAPEPSRSGA